MSYGKRKHFNMHQNIDKHDFKKIWYEKFSTFKERILKKNILIEEYKICRF
jgi:hypothetical protein